MVFVDIKEDGTQNDIIISDVHITVTGMISVYTSIILEGDAMITTTKCISLYNSSRIIIDLTKRSREADIIISYNCANTPDWDIVLQGSYIDGCIPRYEFQQHVLILIFDTDSCQIKTRTVEDYLYSILSMICSILISIIVIGVLFIIVLTNPYIKEKIFSKRKADAINEASTTKLKAKIDLKIASAEGIFLDEVQV